MVELHLGPIWVYAVLVFTNLYLWVIYHYVGKWILYQIDLEQLFLFINLHYQWITVGNQLQGNCDDDC